LKQWKDDQAKQVLDPQIPFILSDILSDDAARAPSFGYGARGLNVPGVKTATKTGTSNLENRSRDLWMMSYTPKVAMGIWAGNHDGGALRDALSYRVGPTVDSIMGPIHRDILQPDGAWKPGDWFQQPQGLQRLTVSGRTDWFPSWYTKPTYSGVTMTFDSVSRKKATDCTPPRAKVELRVEKFKDPVTNKEAFFAPDGYDATKDDDVHKCDDVKPFVNNIDIDKIGKKYTITASVTKGTHPLQNVEIRVNGNTVATLPANGSGNYKTTVTQSNGKIEAVVIAIDSALYDSQASRTLDDD
jgi:penicillin-binding protein 1A